MTAGYDVSARLRSSWLPAVDIYTVRTKVSVAFQFYSCKSACLEFTVTLTWEVKVTFLVAWGAVVVAVAAVGIYAGVPVLLSLAGAVAQAVHVAIPAVAQ